MRKVVLLAALCLLAVCNVQAQTGGTAPAAPAGPVKLGYISSSDLLRIMPEVAKADTQLRAFAKQYTDQIDAIQAEAQRKVADYQAKDATMTDAMREVAQRELQDLQNRLEATQQSAQEKVAKKKEELYAPILEKADKAIKDVAKERGYDYIFDSSAGALLYARDADNIMPFVKAKLGIK